MPAIGIVMVSYIINDLFRMLKYYPVGVGAGVVLFLFFTGLYRRKDKNNMLSDDGKNGEGLTARSEEEKGLAPHSNSRVQIWAQTCLWAYLLVILMITLFDREMESSGVPDLTLFSTLRINTRNNAFLIENILLFLPYGFFLSWSRYWDMKAIWNVGRSLVVGFVTSFWIEIAQMLTKRGCFQVDDIWSNALGSLLGAAIFILIFKNKNESKT